MNTLFLCVCVLCVVAPCSAGNPGDTTKTEFLEVLKTGKYVHPCTTVDELYQISDTCLVTSLHLKYVNVGRTNIPHGTNTDDPYSANLVMPNTKYFLDSLKEKNVVRVNKVEMRAGKCSADWALTFKCFVDFIQDFSGVDIENSYDPGPLTQKAFFDSIKDTGLINSGTTIYDVYKILGTQNNANEITIRISLTRDETDDESYAKWIENPVKTKETLIYFPTIKNKFDAKKVAKVLKVKVMLEEDDRQGDWSLVFYCNVDFVGGFEKKSSDRDYSEKPKSSGFRAEHKFNTNTTPLQQNPEDPYDILGVVRGVPFKEVQQAYRRLLMIYHPDKTGGNLEKEEKAKKIIGAFEAIEQEEKKTWQESNVSQFNV